MITTKNQQSNRNFTREVQNVFETRKYVYM